MDFITVHIGNTQYYLNSKHIVSVRAFGEGSAITLCNDTVEMIINEPPTDVMNKIVNVGLYINSNMCDSSCPTNCRKKH